jgi:hypothetical protein
MHFVYRQRWLLCFVAVLVLSSVMVVKQFLANFSAHIQRREDFLLLYERGQAKSCQQMYERLIAELQDLNERALVEDLQRTALVVDPKSPDLDSPVWKYYTSVKKELQSRAERRLQAIEHATR